jgi:hypothetical protein
MEGDGVGGGALLLRVEVPVVDVVEVAAVEKHRTWLAGHRGCAVVWGLGFRV